MPCTLLDRVMCEQRDARDDLSVEEHEEACDAHMELDAIVVE
jgi:hypothetical protein